MGKANQVVIVQFWDRSPQPCCILHSPGELLKPLLLGHPSLVKPESLRVASRLQYLFKLLAHSSVRSVRPEAWQACTVGPEKQRGSPFLPLLSVALPWSPSCPGPQTISGTAHSLHFLGREQDARNRAGSQGS